MKKWQWVLLVCIMTANGVHGKPLAFPEEELAKESVVPRFDVPNSVRDRNVPVAGKFEIGGFVGAVADEAIFKQFHYGAMATYHFNEIHGLNISYSKMEAGVGNYADEIKKSVNLDLKNTFGPESYLLANYQYSAFYGKLSLLKKLVINTHLYGLAGLGSVNYEGGNQFALSAGVGQRFYLWPNFAIRFDLKLVRFSGPNPVSRSKPDIESGNLKIGDYDTTNYLLSHITGGLVFLF